jgi:hypothetical protein
LVIGKILEKHWSAIVTYRNEKVRIISVRRSRRERRLRYMKAKELDRKFDEGEDISKYLDIKKQGDPGRNRNG